MMEIVKQPWSWYAGGIVIGLTVPALLILGNKHFGISANLRHACAACFPAGIQFFKYEWRKEVWNFLFVGGIMIGSFIAAHYLSGSNPITVHPKLIAEMSGYGIEDYSKLLPAEIFSFKALFTPRGIILLVGGGFLVGFGARYAGGCTSGHSIMGLSSFQLPSLIATIAFMAGGIVTANFVLPLILKL